MNIFEILILWKFIKSECVQLKNIFVNFAYTNLFLYSTVNNRKLMAWLLKIPTVLFSKSCFVTTSLTYRRNGGYLSEKIWK